MGDPGVFATGGDAPLSVSVRLETPGDELGVRRVHDAAFPGPEEAAIVDRIRRDAPADAWPDTAWMARRLPAWTDGMRGTVHYPEAFGPLA